ncbi:MAG TPA: N-acetylmuramoyl-L-alanine amidase [Gemmatimonadales bacterium]
MTIDRTARYHVPRYQRDGTDWTVDRAGEPVKALVLHHSAGWYGPKLTASASQNAETAQIDSLALDHRHRFGIGPGYYYVAFPSGRLYAVGKYGTQRAHTKGKNPATGNWWNRESLAICAMGNYETDVVPEGLMAALREGIAEVRGYTSATIPIYAHGEVPGNPSVSQCPGRHLKACLSAFLANEASQPAPPAVDEARRQVYRAIDALDAATVAIASARGDLEVAAAELGRELA